MKRILLFGLPGAGKTTLAKRLVETLGNADWYNADEIREKFNDWDFSPEGRERQMNRVTRTSRPELWSPPVSRRWPRSLRRLAMSTSCPMAS